LRSGVWLFGSPINQFENVLDAGAITNGIAPLTERIDHIAIGRPYSAFSGARLVLASHVIIAKSSIVVIRVVARAELHRDRVAVWERDVKSLAAGDAETHFVYDSFAHLASFAD
jgi:hypothetical protein